MEKQPLNRSHMHQYVRPKSLQDDLKRLFESGQGSDVKFETQDRSVRLFAHSDVIVARCHALRQDVLAFLSKKKSALRDGADVLVIWVKPVTQKALEQVMRYIYSGIIDLEYSHLYEFSVLAEHFGIPSLQQHIFRFLNDTDQPSMVLYILDRALNDSEPIRSLIARITQCLSSRCSQILKSASFLGVSLLTMQHIVKQESLGASECEIWEALVIWACCMSGVERTQRVSLMTTDERCKVAAHLSAFCRPGHIRILNLDTKFFVSEVEPLDLFIASELLLKYRFDATVGEFPFEATFPRDRYSFLARVRQRCMSFESERHPHPRGTYTKVKVQMPRWVSEMEVTFDERTALGRYADLEFFMDEEGTVRVFSLRASKHDAIHERSLYLSPGVIRSQGFKTPERVQISGNVFWFTFYAPKNVGHLAWGYKFLVSVLR